MLARSSISPLARRATTSSRLSTIPVRNLRLRTLTNLSPARLTTPRLQRQPPRLAPRAAAAAAIPRIRNSHYQSRPLSTETRTAIAAAVSSAPVVLFMKGTPEAPQCGFSRLVIQILGLQGVDPEKFAAFNVLDDPELREGIKEYSDWPTIPQLYVDGEFIGGCDIVTQMHQKGELAQLFEEKGVLVLEEGEAEEKKE